MFGIVLLHSAWDILGPAAPLVLVVEMLTLSANAGKHALGGAANISGAVISIKALDQRTWVPDQYITFLAHGLDSCKSLMIAKMVKRVIKKCV